MGFAARPKTAIAVRTIAVRALAATVPATSLSRVPVAQTTAEPARSVETGFAPQMKTVLPAQVTAEAAQPNAEILFVTSLRTVETVRKTVAYAPGSAMSWALHSAGLPAIHWKETHLARKT